MVSNQNEFMREAIKISIENVKNGGGPFGAVVVKNGEIIGKGVNRVVPNSDPTAHAEIQAIRDATAKLKNFQLNGCELYTSCEPCPMCFGAIYWARVDKIYYANTRADAKNINFDDSFVYDEIGLPIEKRKIPFKQLLRSEGLVAFQAWEKKMDKVPY